LTARPASRPAELCRSGAFEAAILSPIRPSFSEAPCGNPRLSLKSTSRLGSAPFNMPHDHVDDPIAERFKRLRRREVALEYLRESRTVGNVEEAEGTDLPVQLNGIYAGAKYPVANAAFQQAGDGIDRRQVQRLDGRRLREILGVMDILDHNEADEVLVVVVMIEGEADESSQCLHRGQVVEMQVRLEVPNLAVGCLQNPQIESF